MGLLRNIPNTAMVLEGEGVTNFFDKAVAESVWQEMVDLSDKVINYVSGVMKLSIHSDGVFFSDLELHLSEATESTERRYVNQVADAGMFAAGYFPETRRGKLMKEITVDLYDRAMLLAEDQKDKETSEMLGEIGYAFPKCTNVISGVRVEIEATNILNSPMGEVSLKRHPEVFDLLYQHQIKKNPIAKRVLDRIGIDPEDKVIYQPRA